jgi:hypothetical protein
MTLILDGFMGAKARSIMTLSITAFSNQHNNIQHNDTQHNNTQQSA